MLNYAYISIWKINHKSVSIVLHNSASRGFAVDAMHTFNASDPSDFEEKEVVFNFCASVWFQDQGCTLHICYQGSSHLLLALSIHSPCIGGNCWEPDPGAVPAALSVPPQCVILTTGLPGINNFWDHPVCALLSQSGLIRTNYNLQKFKMVLAKIAIFCGLCNHLYFLQQFPPGAEVLYCSFFNCIAIATFL